MDELQNHSSLLEGGLRGLSECHSGLIVFSMRLRMPRLPAGGADGGGLRRRGGGGHSAELQGFASGRAAPVGFQRGSGRGIWVIFSLPHHRCVEVSALDS